MVERFFGAYLFFGIKLKKYDENQGVTL